MTFGVVPAGDDDDEGDDVEGDFDDEGVRALLHYTLYVVRGFSELCADATP